MHSCITCSFLSILCSPLLLLGFPPHLPNYRCHGLTDMVICALMRMYVCACGACVDVCVVCGVWCVVCGVWCVVCGVGCGGVGVWCVWWCVVWREVWGWLHRNALHQRVTPQDGSWLPS